MSTYNGSTTQPVHNATSTLPIGVFWDIENCCVPKGKSALAVVQRIRARFFTGYREQEFMCVCDARKLSWDVIEELNQGQLTVVQVNSTSKNAADDKIRQCIRRYIQTHPAPGTVILISGDVNFAAELSDMRFRQKLHTILIHGPQVQDALLTAASEHYSFIELLTDIPYRTTRSTEGSLEVLVSSLPQDKDIVQVKQRLKQLSDNCGGRVHSVMGDSAIIIFPNNDAAVRACTRMEGEDVYGNKIKVELSNGKNGANGKNGGNGKNGKTLQNGGSSLKQEPRSTPNSPSADKFNKAHTDKTRSTFYGNTGPSQSPNIHRRFNSPSSHGARFSPNGRQWQTRDNRGGSPHYRQQQPQQQPQQQQQQQSYARETQSPSSSISSKEEKKAVPPGGTESSESEGGNLQAAVDKFSKQEKSSRSVLFIQQQLYQEQQERRSRYRDREHQSPSPSYQDRPAPPTYSDLAYRLPAYRAESRSACSSPSPSPRSSPAFRRTPGARRPRSTGPYHNTSGYSSDYGSHHQGQHGDGPFEPIGNRSPLLSASELGGSGENMSMAGSGLCELVVSNLDYNISAREWKKILYTTFQQQNIQVMNVYIQTQSDGTNVGYVRVPTMDEARFAISQFHRKKIGYKRIHVAVVNRDSSGSALNIKNEVLALLKDVNGNSLPLFKFIELFEKRYYRSVSVSELYRMKDTIEIREHSGTGRVICLAATVRNSPVLGDQSDQEVAEIMEVPVCKIHCKEGSTSYIVAIESGNLPAVCLQLKTFAAQVHTLLQTHNGNMPLNSFPVCYEHEFTRLHVLAEGGVPLEHLITCIPGIQISLSKAGIKKVQWAENRPPASLDFGRFCNSPLMTQHLSQFSREIVDLLKHSPGCRMAFSKFIPAYHHHFGRQCRVADYGYTKLMELFEAVPHVVQIIGSGNRRTVTLTHRAQMKRFTSDLLRVLKSQATKQITDDEFSPIYAKVLGKNWEISDYGVCFLEDLLLDLPESTVTVSTSGDSTIIAIPRRDQTEEEKEHTKQFAVEVVDLLRHSPQCRMPFNKFIPAYHHHFGRQCRVADFGFTKLIELFEAIPDILKVIEDDDEKILCLTEQELIKVLTEQVSSLLKTCPQRMIPLHHFMMAFRKHHGHAICLEDYGAVCEEDLLRKISHVVRIDGHGVDTVVVLIDHSDVQRLAHKVLLLLMDTKDGSMKIQQVVSRIQRNSHIPCQTADLRNKLVDFIQVKGDDRTGVVKLNPLQMFARDSRSLLRINQGRLPLNNFESAYASHFGVSLVPASYGFPSLVALLTAVPHVVTIRGKSYRRTVLLCQDFLGNLEQCIVNSQLNERLLSSPPPDSYRSSNATTPSSDSGVNEDEDKEVQLLGLNRKSPIDLLAGPVPSAVPSPALQPLETRQENDLIRFDPSPPTVSDMMFAKDEEKRGQQAPLCNTPISEMLQMAAQLLPNPPRVHPQIKPAAAPPSETSYTSPMLQALTSLELRHHDSTISSDKTFDSDGTPSTPGSSKGTPKRHRMAAKFSVPLEPPRPN